MSAQSVQSDYYLAPVGRWVPGRRYRVVEEGVTVCGIVADPDVANSYESRRTSLPVGTVVTCLGMVPVYGATPGFVWGDADGEPFFLETTLHPSADDPGIDGLPPLEPRPSLLVAVGEEPAVERAEMDLPAKDIRCNDVVEGAVVAVVMPSDPGRVVICTWVEDGLFLRSTSYASDQIVTVLGLRDRPPLPAAFG